MQNLECFIDFKAPASYLAFKPTIALINEFNITPTWRPYISKQSAIPAANSDESRGDTHRRVRAIAQQRTHLMYAKLQNTEMHFRTQPGRSDLALAALLFVQSDIVSFIESAYRAYWIEQADLDSPTVVADLLATTGNDGDGFSAQYLQTLEAHQVSCEEEGIIEAPTFRVAEQVFVGREHLPWIRELLTNG